MCGRNTAYENQTSYSLGCLVACSQQAAERPWQTAVPEFQQSNKQNNISARRAIQPAEGQETEVVFRVLQADQEPHCARDNRCLYVHQ